MSEARPLRALTLSQSWAWAMTIPPPPDRKAVENRKWKLPSTMVGQRFAIHAAKSWDEDGARFLHRLGFRFPSRSTIATAAIVGFATVRRSVTDPRDLPTDQRRWFFGPHGFVFEDVDVLAVPVPAKGMLGFWTVPDAARHALQIRLVREAVEWATERGYSTDYTAALSLAAKKALRTPQMLDEGASPALRDGGVKAAIEWFHGQACGQ